MQHSARGGAGSTVAALAAIDRIVVFALCTYMGSARFTYLIDLDRKVADAWIKCNGCGHAVEVAAELRDVTIREQSYRDDPIRAVHDHLHPLSIILSNAP